MSADMGMGSDMTGPKITVEDVKQRAQAVRDLAKAEAKRAARELTHDRIAQTVAVGVVAVAALASLAYFMGSRKGRAGCPPQLPPWCYPPE